MPLSGKYDFEGIKKWGAKGIALALSTTTWGAWLVGHTFEPLMSRLIEFGINWLANKGLILLNIGAIYIEGEIDQGALDKAIDEGIKRVQLAQGTLTPEQIKEIDDGVIKAADKALPYGKPPKP